MRLNKKSPKPSYQSQGKPRASVGYIPTALLIFVENLIIWRYRLYSFPFTAVALHEVDCNLLVLFIRETDNEWHAKRLHVHESLVEPAVIVKEEALVGGINNNGER